MGECVSTRYFILNSLRRKPVRFACWRPVNEWNKSYMIVKSLGWLSASLTLNGLLTRYAKLRAAHAPGMPGAFIPPPRVSDPNMHHSTCVTHVPWCMLGSLTSDFPWSRWRGKHSRHFRRMRNPQFYVSGKRPVRRGRHGVSSSNDE